MKRQFSKDGHVTTATSAAQAVRLTYDGWQEVHAAPEPAVEAQPDTETSATPTPPRKRTGSR